MALSDLPKVACQGTLPEIQALLAELPPRAAGDPHPAAEWTDSFGRSLLSYAATRNDLEETMNICKYLVEEAGVDVNHEADEKGWRQTALFFACKHSHVSVVGWLLDKQADLHHVDVKGQTCLFYAAFDGRLETTELLLDRKADAMRQDNSDQTPFCYAVRARRQQANTVKALLKRCQSTMSTECRRALLVYSIKEGSELSTCAAILDSSVDVDSIDKNGQSPIFFAARKGRIEHIEMLIKKRAQPDIEDKLAKQTPLFYAALAANAEGVKMLIDNGANAHHRDALGHSPLFYAVRQDPGRHTKDKVDVAYAQNQEKCVKMLMNQPLLPVKDKDSKDNGAGPADIRGLKDNQTPLFHAVQFGGSVATCKILVEGSCNVDSMEAINKQTPIFYAAKLGRVDIMEFLLDQRASADPRDIYGQTPLLFAAQNNQVEACKMLVQKGDADPKALSKHHCSPMACVLGKNAEPRPAALVAFFQECQQIRRFSARKRGVAPNNRKKADATMAKAGPPKKMLKRGDGPQEEGGSGASGGKTTQVSRVSSAQQSAGRQSTGSKPPPKKRPRSASWSAAGIAEDALSALPKAVATGTPAEVRALIEAGHNPKDFDAQTGRNLIFLAAMRPDHNDQSALEMCRLLFEYGVSPTYIDFEMQTPLFQAVNHNLPMCAAYLIQHKAPVDHPDGRGQTALFHATRLESPACVRKLLDCGADPDAKDERGCTALCEAASEGKTHMIPVLVEHEASMSVVDKQGMSVLAISSPSCVQTLVDAKCDPNASGSARRPPLLEAAEQGDWEKIMALVAAGADPKSCDSMRRTALHYAVENKQLETCRKLMLKMDLDEKAEDATGVTPLARAKAFRWAGFKEMESLGKKRKENEARKKREAEAARAQRMHQLMQVARHGPAQQLRDLLSDPVMRKELQAPGSESPLHAAAARTADRGGALEVCTCIVEEASVAPDFRDTLGRTPLFSATAAGNAEVCKYLVEKKCDVNAQDGDGRTALSVAVKHGAAITRTLLDCGANVGHADKQKQTPLFQVNFKDAECLALLLQEGAKATHTDARGQTALFAAVRETHEHAIRALVKARCDPNHVDNEKRTALFFAIRDSRAHTAALLLDECGAEPHGDDMGGMQNDGMGNCDLFDMARDRGLDEIIAKMTVIRERQQAEAAERRAKAQAEARMREQFLLAAATGTSRDLKALIESRADVAHRDSSGSTALHRACARTDEEALAACQTLIEDLGADTTARDSKGRTPVFIAAASGCTASLSFLLDRGVDLSVTDDQQETPLFHAAKGGHAAAAGALLAHGADAEWRDHRGQTAVFSASMGGHVQVLEKMSEAAPSTLIQPDKDLRTPLFDAKDATTARFLLGCGCSVSSVDKQGQTPLFHATSPGVVHALLEAGGKLEHKRQDGMTALFAAIQRESYGIVKALLNAGADTTASTSKGETPLHFAARSGVPLEMVKLLVTDGPANPTLLDKQKATPAKVAIKAAASRKQGASAAVAEFLARAAAAHTRAAATALELEDDSSSEEDSEAGGAAEQAPKKVEQKHHRMRLCLTFADPDDPTGVKVLPFGSKRYEQRLEQLAKECPWLRTDLWHAQAPLTQGPKEVGTAGGASQPSTAGRAAVGA